MMKKLIPALIAAALGCAVATPAAAVLMDWKLVVDLQGTSTLRGFNNAPSSVFKSKTLTINGRFDTMGTTLGTGPSKAHPEATDIAPLGVMSASLTGFDEVSLLAPAGVIGSGIASQNGGGDASFVWIGVATQTLFVKGDGSLGLIFGDKGLGKLSLDFVVDRSGSTLDRLFSGDEGTTLLTQGRITSFIASQRSGFDFVGFEDTDYVINAEVNKFARFTVAKAGAPMPAPADPFPTPPDPVPTAAVPEPATWAMMLFGFAFIGSGMRRRRKPDVALAHA